MYNYLPFLFGLAALILSSAFFSSSETSIFSLSRVQVNSLRRAHPAVYRLVDFFLTKPRRTLSTILVGNEIVNISITIIITGFFANIFPDAAWQAITLYTLCSSVPLILLFGEITPKTMAIRFPESFVRKNTLLLRVAYFVLTPLRVIFMAISGRLITFVAGVQDLKSKILTEEDLKTLVQEGADAGVIGSEEQKMIFNVLRFGDAKVEQIMTPKKKVFSVSAALSIPEIIIEIKKQQFSRIPVYQDDRDNIIGVLHTKELLRVAAKRNIPDSIIPLLLAPLRISPDKDLESAFKELRSQRVHMAIVVNDERKPLGIITMDDLLEELFGTLSQETRGGRNG